MSQINDLKQAALKTLTFTGSLNDQELAFFKSKGATSGAINRAKYEWLVIKGQTASNLVDMENSYCGGTGSLNDRVVARLIAGTYYA